LQVIRREGLAQVEVADLRGEVGREREQSDSYGFISRSTVLPLSYHRRDFHPSAVQVSGVRHRAALNSAYSDAVDKELPAAANTDTGSPWSSATNGTE
jgi:hypothetical protein